VAAAPYQHRDIGHLLSPDPETCWLAGPAHVPVRQTLFAIDGMRPGRARERH